MCYILEEHGSLCPHLVFHVAGVLLGVTLFNTVLWNVNPYNFCIEEGWQSRYYICCDCLIFFYSTLK